MFVVRYHNLIQLALIFAVVCDGQNADQLVSNSAPNDPIVLRLARSTDNKSDTVSQEAENEVPNANKDEPTNQITNKEENSTTSNARSAETKKESSTTTAKPQAASGMPTGLQGWPAGNSKATLIMGTFQAIMMPMPDSPAGFPPAAGAG